MRVLCGVHERGIYVYVVERLGVKREQKSPPPQWKVNKKCLKFEKIVIEVCLVFSFIFFLATKEKPLL